MNKDIVIMIELQRYWDNVLRGREEIDKGNAAIEYWMQRVRALEQQVAASSAEVMKIKNSIKQKEIDLEEKDAKAKKLEERKLLMKSEKELGALENEIKSLNVERGRLEEEILLLFDTLEAKNSGLAALTGEHKEALAQSEKDISMLRERIGRFTRAGEENKKLFDDVLSRLSAAVQSRFQKLTASGNGTAVAKVEGDTCGGCHFQIPAYLAIDAARDDKIVSCTNCGRFIYRDQNKTI